MCTSIRITQKYWLLLQLRGAGTEHQKLCVREVSNEAVHQCSFKVMKMKSFYPPTENTPMAGCSSIWLAKSIAL